MSRWLYTAVGLFLVLGALCVGYLALGVGSPLQAGEEREIKAIFDSVSGLKVGNEVSIAGVRVGRVSEIGLSEDGAALISLSLQKKMEIPDDTIASVAMAGLMGEKYVSLQLGGSDILLDDENNILYDTQPSMDLMGMISKVAFGSIDSNEDSE